MQRRLFLKNLAFAASSASFAGCATTFGSPAVDDLSTLACPPISKVRIGIVGLGNRGPGAVQRYAKIPGCEIAALCDLIPGRAKRQRDWLVKNGYPEPKVLEGDPELWKDLCDSDDVDLLHFTTPWLLHAKQCVYAMKAEKHAVVEVPAAVTVDECWELVETAAKTRRHCMMLENCCYGETELLALSLVRNGVLGTLLHGEAAYLHDLRGEMLKDEKYQANWRIEFNAAHNGNPYPTHGLGPVCQYMDINRGDKFEYLTSVSSDEFGLHEYAEKKYGKDSAKAKRIYKLGDMNTTVVRTARGRTIMVQHDVSNGRPYSRINTIQGTKGILCDYPLRVALESDPHHWLSAEKLKELKDKYTHPLWKSNGAAAKTAGGHGGMDYLLLLRLIHCLNKGLPLDISVYDTALWSSLVELTERSVNKRGASIDVPDFTKGVWKTAKPLGLVDVANA